MTFTRTMTLEELALDRLCSGESVTLADGSEGRVMEIYNNSPDAIVRRISIVDTQGRRHHSDLIHGAVRF